MRTLTLELIVPDEFKAELSAAVIGALEHGDILRLHVGTVPQNMEAVDDGVGRDGQVSTPA